MGALQIHRAFAVSSVDRMVWLWLHTNSVCVKGHNLLLPNYAVLDPSEMHFVAKKKKKFAVLLLSFVMPLLKCTNVAYENIFLTRIFKIDILKIYIYLLANYKYNFLF